MGASWALCRRLVGNTVISDLFQGGFVGSSKWFHRERNLLNHREAERSGCLLWTLPLGIFPRILRAGVVRRTLVPGALMRLGEKNNENNSQGPARGCLRRRGNGHPQQTRQCRSRVRVQAWRQYA